MKPRSSLSNGFTAMVELDTGIYQLAEWSWQEFQIFDPTNPSAEELRQLIGPAVEALVANAREEGKELVYLGYQSEPQANLLDGCVVFSYPGEYRQIRGAVEPQVVT